MEAQARIAASSSAGWFAGELSLIDSLCDELGEAAGARITIIGTDGAVLGDSQDEPARMESHADRPEVREALSGHIGVSQRHSATVQAQMMYVAVPVRSGGEVIGVARAAVPLTEIIASLNAVYARLLAGGVFIAVLAGVIGIFVSRSIMRPVQEISEGAARFAGGDLKARLPIPRTREMAGLAETLNRMAAELDARIQTIERQRNEQEAILASMAEGVIAVDADEHIIIVNESAARIFEMNLANAAGKPLQEAIRNIELQRFAARALCSDELVEDDVAVSADSGKILRAHGVALRDAGQNRIGAVIVLNDITRLKRLENMRREFVGNVSHELKTPITSIKGFVETLLDGALDNHEEAVRFLNIISNHADRLSAIIDDLLLLSRVEQDSEHAALMLESLRMTDVLGAALKACEARAAKKGIPLCLRCPDSLVAQLDAHLFEQAVVNLIDNAIKYSAPGSPIDVSADAFSGGIRVAVSDNGCGITPEHLPRVFERFYRVDKARSRKDGGTGLGLAIVKHIIQAHGGSVNVQSKPGSGSKFTLELPAD